MTRLEQHVSTVRSKMTFSRFIEAVSWTVLGLAAAALVVVLLDKVVDLRLPRQFMWLGIGGGVAVASAFGWAMFRRPKMLDAAIAIDKVLELKEKFSTALSIRGNTDAFSRAAVLDAEQTAGAVSLNRRFPLQVTNRLYISLAACVLVALMARYLPTMDLLSRQEIVQKKILQQQKIDDARKQVEKAMVEVTAIASNQPNSDAVTLAKEELARLLTQPIKDPGQAQRSAMKALQDMAESLKQEVQRNQKFANAQTDSQMFRNLMPSPEQKGLVADAQRAIAKSDYNTAIQDLSQLAQNFEKMEDKDKQEAAKQMKELQNKLQQMANDPQAQKKMQQQLQQLGANPQQAQQMAQAMQQAAAGNPQAQQQLQQMAQQMAGQMNNGQGATQQQMQAMQQAMQGMQAQANGQQVAQGLAQAAAQMAQAMQQGQQGNPGNNQGQGNPQQAQGQMAQGQQAMQQNLQQLQAMQQDLQQMAAAQSAAQKAAQNAANAANNGNGQGGAGNQPGQGNQPKGNGGQGQFANGDPKGQGNGQGGPGIGNGGSGEKVEAAFATTPEVSPSQEIEDGKILAAWLVKADSVKGESKAQLQEVVKQAGREAPDEVEQDRIPAPAQGAVKEYFKQLEKDSK